MSRYCNIEGLSGLEIAVIGVSCRFPGANSPEAYWQNLRDGVCSVSTFTDEELAASRIPLAVSSDKSYVRRNAILDRVDLFDASYFDCSPREAEEMDPQHRIFLECAAEALQSAGYDCASGPLPVGVYAGANINTYLFNLLPALNLIESTENVQALAGNDKDYLATRVSYKLNLRGPSITVQTACSTSLVAIHMASRGLIAGECDLALAGGVSIRVPQKAGYIYQQGGVHSPDGYCRPFDALAQGTTFGSGCGVVVLKRLDQALADNDQIHAIIKGSAVNNDGSAKAGFTAPSVDGQAAVVAAAHQFADVAAETITYIEAHATGTPIGDPIEVQALTEAFRKCTGKTGFCALGSVKSNFGHLVTAAGIAGFIKTVLAIRHRQIPATLHYRQPNPHINFEASPFYVNAVLRDWPCANGPRRAGVSSFGVGGTNAHVVVEEPPPAAPHRTNNRRYHLIPVSARTEAALESMGNRLADALATLPEEAVADAAFTLQCGRREHQHRRAAVCSTLAEAREALQSRSTSGVITGSTDGSKCEVAFLFPGQSTQYRNMARHLFDTEPVFRSNMQRCFEILRQIHACNLQPMIYPASGTRAGNETDMLHSIEFTQPALFAVEYSLAQLLMNWGVLPGAMLGHCLGEYVAATLADVLSLEDALGLVVFRGRLIEKLPQGTMLAVSRPESSVLPLLGPGVALAAVNGPSSCILSGDSASIAVVEEHLNQSGTPCRRLRTSHAFHSPLLNPVLDRFLRLVLSVRLSAPKIPYISNVTGTWISATHATDPSYWVRQLRDTVQFSKGIETLIREPGRLLVEVGPGDALKSLVDQHGGGARAIHTVPADPDPRDPDLVLRRAIAHLWTNGVPIAWPKFSSSEKAGRIPLPTYPFERERYWVEPVADGGRPVLNRGHGPMLARPSWKRTAVPPQQQPKRRTWVVFGGSQLSAAVVGHLQEIVDVVEVHPAERFEHVSINRYSIDPRRRDHYRLLISALAASGRTPVSILHCWNLTSDYPDPASPAVREELLYRGFYSILFVLQILAEHKWRDDVDLIVVGNHLADVEGHAPPCPEKSAVLGVCAAVRREIPFGDCRVIDVALQASPAAVPRVAAQIAAELMSLCDDDLVAFRGLNRWVRIFDHVDDEMPAGGRSILRERGVYLITGGLGGIGLRLAQHLAASRKASLVLTSRSEFPAKSLWQDWIDRTSEDNPTGARIRALQAIEALGGSVLVLQADVTDCKQMETVVVATRREFGTINGVFHAAGTARGNLIQWKTKEECASVLAPKIDGTRILHNLFTDEDLDFMMLFSSSLAIAGAVGQVDYCAANAYLDAFAQYANARDPWPTIAVNWDGWRGLGLNRGLATASDTNKDVPKSKAIAICFVVDISRHWWFADHRVGGIPTLPGTALIELARAAYTQATGRTRMVMEDVYFISPVTAHTTARVHAILEENATTYEFRIESEVAPPEGRRLSARGRILENSAAPPRASIEALIARCGPEFDIPPAELVFDGSQTVQWGARWRNIVRIYGNGIEAVATLQLADAYLSDLDSCPFHPALMDVAGAYLALMSGLRDYLPVSYGRIAIYAPLTGKIHAHARQHPFSSPDRLSFDVTILDDGGNVLIEVTDFAMIRESAIGGSARTPHPVSESSLDEYDPQAALEALDRILASRPVSQVVVTAKEIGARIASIRSRRPCRGLDGSNPPARHSRPRTGNNDVEPRSSLEKTIVEIWQEALGIERVSLEDNFFELGGHSLLAMEIVDRLRRAHQIEIPLAKLMELQTVAAMARHVERVRDEVEQQRKVEILRRLAEMSDAEAASELQKRASSQ